MVLLLLVCTISSVIGQPEECSSQRKALSQCGNFAGNTDEVDEAVSLLQVGAKRLQKTAASPNSTDNFESLAQVAENVSVVSATSPNKVEEERVASLQEEAAALQEEAERARKEKEVAAPAVSPREEVLSLLSYFQQSGTRGSAFAIVVLVAIIGIAALCLLGMILQPETSREGWHAYPRSSREVYERPVVRQGGYTQSVNHPFGAKSHPGFDSTRPSVRSLGGAGTFKSLPPQPYEGVAASRSATEAVLPRVSLPPSAKDSMKSLPRVKQAVGSSLSLTPAGSIMPKKEDETMQLGEAMPPELTGNAPPRRPVPICPFLVLPHCDAFFAVPVNLLVGGANSVEVLGLSGSALLRVTIKDTSAGRVIEVSMSPPRSPALASITEAPEHGPRAGMMEIKACKGSSGTHYGWLRSSKTVFGNSCHVLQAGGDDVMTVVTDAAHGSCQLFAGSNGDRLAQAARSGDGEGIFNPEDLEIRVTPGMDAVLALLCVLSIALFGCGDKAFTFPPSRHSA